MTGTALYRLPHEKIYHRLEQHNGQPLLLPSCAEIGVCQGFVMAPFLSGPDHPVIVIRPDVVSVQEVPPPTDARWGAVHVLDALTERKRYAIDFHNFHAQLCQGSFRKIVLARCSQMEADKEGCMHTLFFNACHAYPRLFVAMVSTAATGTWLMATPETLLLGNGCQWQTMALAGTMKLTAPHADFDMPGGHTHPADISWSDKNRFEQRVVADYIEQCIEQFTSSFSVSKPYTVRAGNLIHLRTDFRFTLPHTSDVGALVNALHPTPAVCGMPKNRAYSFIVSNESAPRRYYSGFAGPLNMEGQTQLFVSLRCMRTEGRKLWLYAGGGLLPDSVEEDEWNETEVKMETMRNLFQFANK